MIYILFMAEQYIDRVTVHDSYGVGAVLSHEMESGALQPIAYPSRTLSPPEQKYTQVDQEALAIVFGVTKFRQYLLGLLF